MIRRRVLIGGRVQGVWFRDSCCDQARRHGVSGWVRNLPDGRVEAVLEGEREAVDAVVEWCGIGPPRARVEHVEVHEEEPSGAIGFDIKL